VTDPTRLRAPRRDATENRAALLAAARTVLKRDPEGSLDEIAREAGLSRRALYGHFASREALVLELIEQGIARITARLADVSHPEPLVRLALIAARLWAEVRDVRVMAEFAVRGPHQRLVGARLAPLRSRVRAAVAEGVADGTVRDDIPVNTLARLLEGAALTVLDEAARRELDAATGHRLVVLSVLSLAGLDAAGAHRLVERVPELGRVAEPATDGTAQDGAAE